MKLKYSVLFLSLVILFFSSCAPSYYPTQANVPLLKEEGDGRISASVSLRGIDFQGSYAITENFAIAGGFNRFFIPAYQNEGQKSRFFHGESKGMQFDITPGIYSNLGDGLVIELFGGYGYGRTLSEDVSGSIHKFSIQPSIGYTGNLFEVAFTTRLIHARVEESAILDKSFSNELNGLFFEPVATLRIGAKAIKLTGQLGSSWSLINEPDFPREGNTFENHFYLIVNVGLQYNFSAK